MKSLKKTSKTKNTIVMYDGKNEIFVTSLNREAALIKDISNCPNRKLSDYTRSETERVELSKDILKCISQKYITPGITTRKTINLNTSARYTISRCRANDDLYGPVHGSEAVEDTICGQEITRSDNWYILTNDRSGAITCKKCIAVINKEVNK